MKVLELTYIALRDQRDEDKQFGRHLRLEKMPTETGLSKRRQTLVETLEWNRVPKGGRTGLNRPWDPVP